VRSRSRTILEEMDRTLFGEIRAYRGGLPDGYWINRVLFTADGKSALAASGGVMCYGLDTGAMRYRGFEVQFARQALVLSPDGKHFLTGHDNSLRIGEVPTGKEVAVFAGHGVGIQASVWSPDGKQVVSGSKDGTIRLCDVATGKEVRRFGTVGDTTRALAFAPEESMQAVGVVTWKNYLTRSHSPHEELAR
jgi:WD40 repeat protein